MSKITQNKKSNDLKILTLRIEKPLWKALRLIAVHNDSSVHQVLIEALEDHKKKNKKLFDTE